MCTTMSASKQAARDPGTDAGSEPTVTNSGEETAVERPGQVNAQVGRYELLGRLARGGMAELFLAIQKSVAGFETLLVIKRILPPLNQDQAFVDMLLHEARVAALDVASPVAKALAAVEQLCDEVEAFARDGGGIAELTALQAALIDHGLSLLKPGGRLIYAVCSLLPAEGEDQLAAALARHPVASKPGGLLGRLFGAAASSPPQGPGPRCRARPRPGIPQRSGGTGGP